MRIAKLSAQSMIAGLEANVPPAMVGRRLFRICVTTETGEAQEVSVWSDSDPIRSKGTISTVQMVEMLRSLADIVENRWVTPMNGASINAKEQAALDAL